MKKLLFICLPGLDHFLKPILQTLCQKYEVRQVAYTHPQACSEALAWADLIWLEWANQAAIELSQLPVLRKKRVICRIHSYEVLDGSIRAVNWSAIQHAIFVAKHVQELACKESPALREFPLHHHIPNGVDPARFPFREHHPGLKLAFVGDLSHKKGLMLLMQAFQLLTRLEPGLSLNIAGRPLELRYLAYLDHFIGQNGLQHQVEYHGWVENLPAWLAAQDFLISSSPWESQGMAVMEAMMLGIKPLIHHFVGAEQIYPAHLLWQNLEQLPALFKGDYDSQTYRAYILKHFEVHKMHQQIEDVVQLCLQATE